MPDIVLEMDHVFKRFKKGEIFDSLRDLIPALSNRLLKGSKSSLLRRNEFWALSDISFYVNKGEALGIIGANGAGKSTILKLLCGIMKPTTGNIRVNGALSALIEVGAGFHPDLTGRENIFLNGTILGMRKEEIKNKFDEIVDFSGLADFIDTPVKRYSSGMYARLAFSVAAHVDPDILVVDEVLSVGDYVFQNKCINKMESVLGDGATVIFVSHNLQAVTGMCHRCLLLEHGKIIKEGPASEVVRQYLSAGEDGDQEKTSREVFISKVLIRGENEEKLQFEAGQKVFMEIEIKAAQACEKLSVSVVVYNDNNYEIFNTSTERLNQTTFSLKEGETKLITFQLVLHLAPGTYYVGTYIYRYDIQKMYDARYRAKTIYIRSDQDVRGIVNLYPKATLE